MKKIIILLFLIMLSANVYSQGSGGGFGRTLSADAPVEIDAQTFTVSMPSATATQDGYLTKEKFVAFDALGSTDTYAIKADVASATGTLVISDYDIGQSTGALVIADYNISQATGVLTGRVDGHDTDIYNLQQSTYSVVEKYAISQATGANAANISSNDTDIYNLQQSTYSTVEKYAISHATGTNAANIALNDTDIYNLQQSTYSTTEKYAISHATGANRALIDSVIPEAGVVDASTGTFVLLNTTTFTWSASQVVTVDAGNKAQFTTITGGLGDITDASSIKKYIVKVYPGTYNENITGIDNVEIRGVGSRGGAIITGSSGTLYSFPQFGGNISNLTFKNAFDTNNAECINIPSSKTDTVEVRDCNFDIDTSTAGIVARVLDVNGGSVTIRGCSFTYDINADSGGDIDTHLIADVNGTTAFSFIGNNVSINIADSDDNIFVIDNNSTNAMVDNLITLNSFRVNFTSNQYSGAATILSVKKGTENHFMYNQVLSSSNGNGTFTAYSISEGDTATIDDMSNHIDIHGYAIQRISNIGNEGSLELCGSIVHSDGTLIENAGTGTISGSYCDGNTGSAIYFDNIDDRQKSFALVHMDTNSVVNVTQDVFEVMDGTYTLTRGNNFTVERGTFTYTGTFTKNFLITIAMTVKMGATNANGHWQLSKNSVLDADSEMHRKFGAGGDLGAVPMVWEFLLATNDKVSLYGTSTTDSTTIEFEHLIIAITQID